jgi:hypothetical protein
MSRKIQIVLPDPQADQLAELAANTGGDPTWRQEMRGQIVALHGRYPRALANLKDDWWTDEQHTEMLCALATWRSELDDAGVDPRDELAFQTQLNNYTHTLQREGGGVTKTWTPGAPPTSEHESSRTRSVRNGSRDMVKQPASGDFERFS